jgi:hypothetical protein
MRKKKLRSGHSQLVGWKIQSDFTADLSRGFEAIRNYKEPCILVLDEATAKALFNALFINNKNGMKKVLSQAEAKKALKKFTVCDKGKPALTCGYDFKWPPDNKELLDKFKKANKKKASFTK